MRCLRSDAKGVLPWGIHHNSIRGTEDGNQGRTNEANYTWSCQDMSDGQAIPGKRNYDIDHRNLIHCKHGGAKLKTKEHKCRFISEVRRAIDTRWAYKTAGEANTTNL